MWILVSYLVSSIWITNNDLTIWGDITAWPNRMSSLISPSQQQFSINLWTKVSVGSCGIQHYMPTDLRGVSLIHTSGNMHTDLNADYGASGPWTSSINLKASGKRYLRQATTDESLYGNPDFWWSGFDTMLEVKNMSLDTQKRVRGTD